jgi:hypothetical protein
MRCTESIAVTRITRPDEPNFYKTAPSRSTRIEDVTFTSLTSRAALAYVAAAVVGYLCAITFATSANLIHLARIGADIGIGDAVRTWLFDLWGMTPRFTELARYGNVMLIGFAIAFPVAMLVRHAALKAGGARLAPLVLPLSGAVALGTGLTIMFQQYEVTAVAGARGGGFWAQCAAGAIAGFVFERVWARRDA